MKKIVITGCAGFIGSHLTRHFLQNGDRVIGVDNLSRRGSEANLDWIGEIKRGEFVFSKIDIRDYRALEKVCRSEGPFDLVIHQAAQVAVTSSVINPRFDFEVNALGTFNVLEATRAISPDAFFEFASTNKVYGKMEGTAVVERNRRYEYEHLENGVDESTPLDFHSPYGCSKGSADQYVRDYSRIYGIRSVVLRQSCIYGTRQFGVEDQGWVAWFSIAATLGKRITIYGDGKQGRDLLWIDDLVAAYDGLFRCADRTAGNIYNVGGGSRNILSLLELVAILKDEKILRGDPVFDAWRPGDQRIFVCDTRKLEKDINWQVLTEPRDGVKKLLEWCRENVGLLQAILE